MITTATTANQTATTHNDIFVSWVCSSMSRVIKPISARTSLCVIAKSSRLLSWPCCHTDIPFWQRTNEKDNIWSTLDRPRGKTDKTMCGTCHSCGGTHSGHAICFRTHLDYLNRFFLHVQVWTRNCLGILARGRMFSSHRGTLVYLNQHGRQISTETIFVTKLGKKNTLFVSDMGRYQTSSRSVPF